MSSMVSTSSTGILWTKVPLWGLKGVQKSEWGTGRTMPVLTSALGTSSRLACSCDRCVCCTRTAPLSFSTCLPGLAPCPEGPWRVFGPLWALLPPVRWARWPPGLPSGTSESRVHISGPRGCSQWDSLYQMKWASSNHCRGSAGLAKAM